MDFGIFRADSPIDYKVPSEITCINGRHISCYGVDREMLELTYKKRKVCNSYGIE
jgi:hypothetical protein